MQSLNLYEEDAENVIAQMGKMIEAGTLKTRYTMEGVLVSLELGPVKVSFKDFERIIQIFTEEPFGPSFAALRKQGTYEDEEQYLALVRQAVAEFFPFP